MDQPEGMSSNNSNIYNVLPPLNVARELGSGMSSTEAPRQGCAPSSSKENGTLSIANLVNESDPLDVNDCNMSNSYLRAPVARMVAPSRSPSRPLDESHNRVPYIQQWSPSPLIGVSPMQTERAPAMTTYFDEHVSQGLESDSWYTSSLSPTTSPFRPGVQSFTEPSNQNQSESPDPYGGASYGAQSPRQSPRLGLSLSQQEIKYPGTASNLERYSIANASLSRRNDHGFGGIGSGYQSPANLPSLFSVNSPSNFGRSVRFTPSDAGDSTSVPWVQPQMSPRPSAFGQRTASPLVQGGFSTSLNTTATEAAQATEIQDLKTMLKDTVERCERYRAQKDEFRKKAVAQKKSMERALVLYSEALNGDICRLCAPSPSPESEVAEPPDHNQSTSSGQQAAVYEETELQSPAEIASNGPASLFMHDASSMLQTESSSSQDDTGFQSRSPRDSPDSSSTIPAFDVQSELGFLFRDVEEFSQVHGSTANSEANALIMSPTWDILNRFADRATTAALLANEETQWALIARIICHFLVERIFSLEFFEGMSQSTQHELEDIALKMQRGVPNQAKRELSERKMFLIQAMVRCPQWQEFVAERRLSLFDQLYRLLEHLCYTSPLRNRPFLDLEGVISKAVEITVYLHSMPVEWIFKFPTVGDKFSSHTMQNKDSKFSQDSAELNARHLRVKIAVTPNVIKRDIAGRSLLVSTLHNSGVLLMS